MGHGQLFLLPPDENEGLPSQTKGRIPLELPGDMR